MLTGCEKLETTNEKEKCRSSHTDENLPHLQAKSALILCREQRLCRPDEKPQELEENPKIPETLEAIPDVEPSASENQDLKNSTSSVLDESYS